MPTYDQEVIADTPLGFYNLEEVSGSSATDSSGNSRNATYASAPVLQKPSLIATEASGKAAEFVDNSRLHVPDNAFPTGSGALEMWVNHAANEGVVSSLYYAQAGNLGGYNHRHRLQAPV